MRVIASKSPGDLPVPESFKSGKQDNPQRLFLSHARCPSIFVGDHVFAGCLSERCGDEGLFRLSACCGRGRVAVTVHASTRRKLLARTRSPL